MARLIDADALIDSMNGEFTDHIEEFRAITIVNDVPTIDAVEVVRCKECKHASDNKVYGCMCNHFNDNDWSYHRMYADDYCSYGEREGE